jgi:hypothetical protein
MMPIIAGLVPLVIYACQAQSNPDSLLNQRAYPSPFAEWVTFRLRMYEPGYYRLIVYDVVGRPVRTLFRGFHGRSSGMESVAWDGTDQNKWPVLPGVYILVVSRDNEVIDFQKAIKYPAFQ